jgi:hypothetical protein
MINNPPLLCRDAKNGKRCELIAHHGGKHVYTRKIRKRQAWNKKPLLTLGEYAPISAAFAPAPDPVNHPAHYTFGKIEVIDVIEDWQLNFHCGQVVKYVARAGRKDPAKHVEDLQKGAYYLNREIERLKKQNG